MCDKCRSDAAAKDEQNRKRQQERAAASGAAGGGGGKPAPKSGAANRANGAGRAAEAAQARKAAEAGLLGVRWSASPAKQGDRVKVLVSLAPSVPAGTRVTVRIFEKGREQPAEALKVFEEKSGKGELSVEWTCDYDAREASDPDQTRWNGRFPEYIASAELRGGTLKSAPLQLKTAIALQVDDEEGRLITDRPFYVLRHRKSPGIRYEGRVSDDGWIRIADVKPANFDFELKGYGASDVEPTAPAGRPEQPGRKIQSARWGADWARGGEEVALVAELGKAVSDGTDVVFTIFEHNANGRHTRMKQLTGKAAAGSARVSWSYKYVEDQEEGASDRFGFKFPEYFFEVECAGEKSRSARMLEYKTSIELQLTLPDGTPITDQPAFVLSGGPKEIKGTADADGWVKVPDMPPGNYKLEVRLYQVLAFFDEAGKEVGHGH